MARRTASSPMDTFSPASRGHEPESTENTTSRLITLGKRSNVCTGEPFLEPWEPAWLRRTLNKVQVLSMSTIGRDNTPEQELKAIDFLSKNISGMVSESCKNGVLIHD